MPELRATLRPGLANTETWVAIAPSASVLDIVFREVGPFAGEDMQPEIPGSPRSCGASAADRSSKQRERRFRYGTQ